MNATDILESMTGKETDAGRVFSGKHTGAKVMGYAKSSLFTPKPKKD